MHKKSSKALGCFVTGFWILNLLVLLAGGGYWLFTNNASVRAYFISPTPANTPTLAPTGTYTPTTTNTATPTNTSTLTPSPTITLTPTQTFTPTPVPFSEGPIVIGYSVQNRPLEVYRFGTGSTERLIVAGMHGGAEYNTVQLADELITYINEHPEVIPAGMTLYIMHDLNPDGVALAHDYRGRANANGVDLNRNWDANWQAKWPPANCWSLTVVTAGTGPGSEPETKALMTFIQAHAFDALINYHSAALGIFAGGLPPDKYSVSLADTVAKVTTYPYPPVDTGCMYTGAFTDWADVHGIAAIDVELTSHTHTDFDMNLKVLDAFLKWKR